MSGESPSTLDSPTPDQIGPFAQLIAEALGRLGLSEHKAAQKITDAAWDASGNCGTVHASTVSRWLSGNIAQPRLRKWTSDALGIPLRDLNAAAAAQRTLQRKFPAATAASGTATFAVESDSVKRRAFAQLLALGGASALTGIDFDRYAAVLAGTRADDRALDDFERITLDLVRQEATVSPSSLMPAVRGHLTGLRDVLVWTPPALAPRAYSIAGQTALLAGYLLFKQRRHADADGYWTIADRFGDMSGDPRLRAAGLLFRAWRWRGGDPSLTLSQLDGAASLIAPTPDPTVAAVVLFERARCHAEYSQAERAHASCAMRDIDSAQTQMAHMSDPTRGFLTVESVAGQASECRSDVLLYLNRPQEAAAELGRLLAAVDPGWLSWRSNILSRLAVAHSAMGDPERACELLCDSLQLAAQASAPRWVDNVREQRRRWLPGHVSPAACLLDEQLHALALPLSDG